MRVAIAGAHGKIAMRLARLLAARGDQVIGVIRNPDHADEVRDTGAEPIVCDLERASVAEIADALGDPEAVVFAAGAGPGSGAERKLTMDRDGAIKLLHATEAARSRYVIVSSIGAQDPPAGDDAFSVYLRAKAEADAALSESDRDWTIIRPGRLSDDPGTGRLRLDSAPFRGEVARDDVAALIAAVLRDARASRHIIYVNGGEDPIEQALDSVV